MHRQPTRLRTAAPNLGATFVDHDDWDQNEEEDWDTEAEDDESIVVRCPSCRRDVYEDAERCPHCGDYIVHSTRAWDGRPLWWVIGGLVGIVAVIWLLVRSAWPM
jgi:hypothetical protein